MPHLIHSVSAGGSVQWLWSGWFWGPKRSTITTALVLFSDAHPPLPKGLNEYTVFTEIFDLRPVSINGSVFKRQILGASSISWYAEGLPPILFCTNFLRQTDGFSLDYATMQICRYPIPNKMLWYTNFKFLSFFMSTTNTRTYQLRNDTAEVLSLSDPPMNEDFRRGENKEKSCFFSRQFQLWIMYNMNIFSHA